MPHSFEVCLVKDTGARFGQRKKFILDLEALICDFYETVGKNLKAWQAPAPKVRKGRDEAEDVTPEALGEEPRTTEDELSRPEAEWSPPLAPDASGSVRQGIIKDRLAPAMAQCPRKIVLR